MSDEIQSENALNAEPEVVEPETSIVEPEQTESETPEAEKPEVPAETKSPEPESELPDYAKQRLARQEHRHKKELRAVNEKFDLILQRFSQFGNQSGQPPVNQPLLDPVTGQPVTPGSVEETVLKTMHGYSAIQRAQAQAQEQERKNLEEQALVQQMFHEFQDKMDEYSETYEDFDEVVRAEHIPFTNVMRDKAMGMSNGVEVLYQLGKNREELNRIASLNRISQAKAMTELSEKLIREESKGVNALSKSKSGTPMKPLKNNPVPNSSSRITDKSSVSEIENHIRASLNKWGG